MEHTLEFRREIKKLNVTESMLAMADLMAVGYNSVDAFKICFPENMKYLEKQQKSIMENMLASAKFKKLLDARKSRVKESAIPVELDEVELIESDEVAKEILRSAKSAPIGSKERAELFEKYYDISKNKNMEIQKSTDKINFYFPVKCSQCPLYKTFDEMMHEDGLHIKPEHMGAITRASIALSYPTAKKAFEIIYKNHEQKPGDEEDEEIKRIIEHFGAKQYILYGKI